MKYLTMIQNVMIHMSDQQKVDLFSHRQLWRISKYVTWTQDGVIWVSRMGDEDLTSCCILPLVAGNYDSCISSTDDQCTVLKPCLRVTSSFASISKSSSKFNIASMMMQTQMLSVNTVSCCHGTHSFTSKRKHKVSSTKGFNRCPQQTLLTKEILVTETKNSHRTT